MKSEDKPFTTARVVMYVTVALGASLLGIILDPVRELLKKKKGPRK